MTSKSRLKPGAGWQLGSRFLISSVGALSLLGLPRCSDSQPESTGNQVKADPCKSVFSESCGQACTGDSDCAAGLYCQPGGTCTADCGGGVSKCNPGAGCSGNGRCEGNGAGGNSSSGSGSGGSLVLIPPSTGDGGSEQGSGGGPVCADITLELADTIPTVVLLIDRSSSMSDSKLDAANPSSPDRWTALKTALLAPAGVLASLEAKVRFGVVLYGNDEGSATCPDLDKTLMPPALNRYAAIQAHYQPLNTIPNTPTGQSVQSVAVDLAAFTEPGPKYIVLATDGFPDRCDQSNEDADGLSRDLSVAAVKAAYDDHDVSTFVISVGTDVSDTHLQHLANVGAGMAQAVTPGAEFFKVTTQAALTAAFGKVIGGVRSCVFTLNGEIDPDLADKGRVLLDGAPVPFDPINGWKVNSATEIEIVGQACQAIAVGEHALSASFPCEVVRKPPA